MIEQFRDIHGASIAVDFNSIAKFFPAGLPDNGITRLNEAAQVSGFGHPFRVTDDVAATRTKLESMLGDDMFKMGFCHFFGSHLGEMHKAIERINQPPRESFSLSAALSRVLGFSRLSHQ